MPREAYLMTTLSGSTSDASFPAATDRSMTSSNPSSPRRASSTVGRDGDSSAELKSLSEQDTLELVSLFKLLADETRLHVLYYLTQCQELNVGAICRLLGQSQPAVSHHLALLKGAGLIDMRRAGKHNYYRVVPHKIREHLDTLFTALPSR